MRDVIVVGAGAGGPVVAKELAERGLDVLLLEAGPAWEHSEREWSHHEDEANNPATGIFRFGPGDRTQAPWARDLPQNCFVWQTAGVGGSTVHYFGNSPRAMPGAFAGYEGADASAYDTTAVASFTYRELIPYYEWVEHTLPVQTAAMGTKEEQFLRAAAKLGLPTQTSKDISGPAFRPQENAILQPQGTAGRTNKAKQLVYPRAKGCTFCGHCPQGCFLPLASPRNLRAKRSTHTSYVPMALTASRWQPGGRDVTLVTDAFATKIGSSHQGGETIARSVTWLPMSALNMPALSAIAPQLSIWPYWLSEFSLETKSLRSAIPSSPPPIASIIAALSQSSSIFSRRLIISIRIGSRMPSLRGLEPSWRFIKWACLVT